MMMMTVITEGLCIFNIQDWIINAVAVISVVFYVVSDPFNYITFFGLRKHEEMCGRLVCIVSDIFICNYLYTLSHKKIRHKMLCSNLVTFK